MAVPKQVVVSGGFDDIKSHDLRFLEEAAKLGELTVLLWPDAALEKNGCKPPKFSFAERSYFLNAVRYVSRVVPLGGQPLPDSLPVIPGMRPGIWADVKSSANPAREQFCRAQKISYRVFNPDAVKDITLYKGAVPARYGGRLASVLDVRMKEGNNKTTQVTGGIGTIFGPIVGALVFGGLETYLAQFGDWVTVTQGAIFIACVIAFRRGIVGEIGARLRLVL